MVREVIDALALKNGEIVLDATYGQGGHSAALRRAAKIKLIALDADPATKVLTGNFADLKKIAARLGVEKIDKAIFDLGWNRGQLGAGKGFSFLTDEPLNMSYGPQARSGFTAAEILNTFSEKALADIFFGYGEERYARRIAKKIVERRKLEPLSTTLELVEIVKDAVPPACRHGRLHPATKTFQALRVAVNDELKSLEQGLVAAWNLLAPCGRIAVVTFHSVEDRVVKKLFAQFSARSDLTRKVGPCGKLPYKKPLVPTRAEVICNPAARSAKLRAIEKVCQKPKA